MDKPHTFGGSLLDRFIDMEASEGSGDPGGSVPAASAEPAADAGVDPAPAITPDTTGEAAADPGSGEQETPAWAGPSEEQWQAHEETVAELRERNEMLEQYLASQQTGAEQNDTAAEKASLYAAFEQAALEGDVQTQFAVMERLNEIQFDERMGPVRPAIDAVQAQQAEQTAKGWLAELNVPEPDWEDVALLANGFRAASPGIEGRQAAQIAQQRIAERDARIRADERAKIQQEQQTEQERLRQLAGAPSTPAGATGVETPFREDEDELAGWRRFKDRLAAGQ